MMKEDKNIQGNVVEIGQVPILRFIPAVKTKRSDLRVSISKG